MGQVTYESLELGIHKYREVCTIIIILFAFAIKMNENINLRSVWHKTGTTLSAHVNTEVKLHLNINRAAEPVQTRLR